MVPRKREDERDELGQLLFEAREAVGLRQTDVRGRTGISQNKLSRAEHKQGHLLTRAQATALLDVYKVRGKERRRILAMIESGRTERVDARFILQKGQAHHFQERLRTLADEARQVRSFVLASVIGYLQSPAYMRVVFTQRMTVEQAEPAVQSRLAQQRLLDDPNREWMMIQTEGGLRWNLGGGSVMAEQIDRIAWAVDRSNVTFGLIPWHKSVDLLPMTGFHIYDRHAVVVGTWSGTAIIRERDEIEQYEQVFDRLRALATFGDDAQAELRRIADEYRSLEDK